MSNRIACPNCGYENSPTRINCKECRTNLRQAGLSAQRGVSVPISADKRREILQRELMNLSAQGFIILHQSDTMAQLRKPKTFNFGLALLGLLFYGVGLLPYLLYYLAKKDTLVSIEVDEYGNGNFYGDLVTKGSQSTNKPTNWNIAIIVGLIILVMALMTLVGAITAIN